MALALALRDYPYPCLLSAPLLTIVDVNQLFEMTDVWGSGNGYVRR